MLQSQASCPNICGPCLGPLHHATAIGKYTLVLITQPGNSVIDNLGVKMRDLAVADVEANHHLLAYNVPVPDTWIIRVHREPLFFTLLENLR